MSIKWFGALCHTTQRYAEYGHPTKHRRLMRASLLGYTCRRLREGGDGAASHSLRTLRVFLLDCFPVEAPEIEALLRECTAMTVGWCKLNPVLKAPDFSAGDYDTMNCIFSLLPI